MTEQKDPFEEKVKQALDQSVDEFDQQTLADLNRIRQSALNGRHLKMQPTSWRLWAPAGGVAAATLVVALWATQFPMIQPSEMPAPDISDVELIGSENDLELMQDLEFVAWLMAQEESNAG
ncbi:MAG: hypothetical protein CSA49_04550 [Gammaproteobacteria bacterium]|nr:MAG: hypothetical protein CSA49_04550 [Gammaproteobacteria bacterium]